MPIPGELRRAWRSLLRAPGFTLATVGSLSLGLTLAAATLSVVNAYLVRSLPFPDSERLYHVDYAEPGQREPEGIASLDWEGLSDVVELADASTPSRLLMQEATGPIEMMALLVTGGSVEALGIRAALGRGLVREDFVEGAEPATLISHALWQSRFGGDPAVLGRSLVARQMASDAPPQTFVIVGVLPPDFRYARAQDRVIDLVAPLRFEWPAYMVRLREGVPPAAAEARITEAVSLLGGALPLEWPGVRLASVHDRYVASVRPVLVAVTFAVAMVLAIVCLNIGVLMLLRALRRENDIAVRVALGAGNVHLVRTLAAESSLICGVSLLAALGLTRSVLGLLWPAIEARLGTPAPGGATAMALDSTVVTFVTAVAVLIAFALSLLPLRVGWSRRLHEVLRGAGKGGTDSRAMRRVRSWLVSLEVGASVALLVGSALMIRTVVTLVRTDLGYRTEGVARARIALPEAAYPDEAAFTPFFDELSARLSEGTTPFALTSFIPFFEYDPEPVQTEDGSVSGVTAAVFSVSEGYFALMDVPVKEGRAFRNSDRESGEAVALVSESLARRLSRRGSALGQRILLPNRADPDEAPAARTVVGVTADVRQTHTDEELEDVYLPFAQSSSRYAPLYLRTELPPEVWLEELRATVSAIDPQVLVTANVTGGSSLELEARRVLGGPKFVGGLLTGVSLFAGVLALLGVYGVTSYGARQREREVGIRVAVGATRAAVTALFVKEGFTVIGAGVVGGLAGGALVAKLLEGQLHGVSTFDASTFGAAAALMLAAGLLAVWLPARRAASVSPMSCLSES